MSLDADFGEMETAAQDLRAILANLSEGNAMAAPPTTGILPAGVDEVSAAVTARFNTHGLAYQQLATAAEEFHQRFANLLSSACASYRDTEIACGQMLRTAIDDMEQPFVPMLESAGMINKPLTQTTAIPTNVNQLALVMGGTGHPVVSSAVLSKIDSMYFPGLPAYALSTPEQLWPGTPQLGALTLDQSVTQGVQLLNSEIQTQLAAGNKVTVFGFSQSSLVATDEVRNLMAQGSPGQPLLKFVLTGDPNNPNGGMLERFTGMNIPFVGITANGATPPNSPYPTAIFTNQYDPVSDFPQYPLNVVADLNAVFGQVQHNCTIPISDYVRLATSPGYTGQTSYYEYLDPTLPLLDPLRDLPFPLNTFGNALADLLQPDLRVLVDMGYGSGYANVPTPASLFPHHDWFHILPDLVHGAVQGVQGFAHDLGFPVAAPTGYPYSPVLYPDLNYS